MDSTRLSTGQTLGDYRVEEQEPRGRCASAVDQRTGRRVLLQSLPHVLNTTAIERTSASERLNARSRLHHPQLADLLAFDLDGTSPFVAFAFRDGQLLDHWLEQQPSRFVGATETALAGILLGLADAAGASLRLTGAAPDITAENILFLDAGDAVLLAAGQSWPTRGKGGKAPSPAELRALQQIGRLTKILLTVSKCDSVELRQMAAACASAPTDRSPRRLSQVISSLRRLAREALPEGLGDELDPVLDADEASHRAHLLALGIAGLLTVVLLLILGYLLAQTN